MNGTFDFVVIGSGSAGGVLAARLSENGKYTVACVEAGTCGPDYLWSRVPGAVGFMFDNPAVNWCYQAEPNPALGGRGLIVPVGKMIGGTSSINGMIYNRGQREDYDRWAALGCRGWSYADVLPYFKKIESTAIGDDDYRGRSGPVAVTLSEKTTPFFDLFTQAAIASGLPANPDYSGPTQYGVAMAQHTVLNGVRQSVATQYLAPARGRSNLTMITGAEATSLVFEGTRCIGVRVRRHGATETLRAAREVIVCAGAINSPKLLELSGIGDPTTLARHGIGVVRASPGVGANLRDHYGPALQWQFNRPGYSLVQRGRGLGLVGEVLRYLVLRRGLLSQGWATMRVFTRSDPSVERTDIALLANPFLIEIAGAKRMMSPIDGFFLFAQVQRPESTGSVHIRSADPFAAPAIRPNYLDTELDRFTAITSVKLARRIAATAPLADVIERELAPGPEVRSDDEILDFIRRFGTTTFHYCGTCRMGNDATAVVDERLRVHGVAGLRVADASITPMIISGNTSIPCMMIGEKCADMILRDAATQG